MSCPICGDDAAEKYKPFCSRRCADVDLARWMNGSYVVQGAEEEDSDFEPLQESPMRPQ